MTQEELKAIYEDCKDFDDPSDEFEMRIEKLGGKVFWNDWRSHTHESVHVEEDMIQFMKECEFQVFDHPEEEKWECDHWVVFPPNK